MQLNKKNLIVVSMVLGILLCGVGIAVVKWQIEISGEITVKGYEFKMYELDGETELTFMQFGTCEKGISNEYRFQIENVGDYNAYAFFSFDIPEGVITYEIVHVTVWADTAPTPADGTYILLGTMEKFELRYTVLDTAPRGTFDTTLTIFASDTSTLP